jgi:hypothetical protein
MQTPLRNRLTDQRYLNNSVGNQFRRSWSEEQRRLEITLAGELVADRTV